MTEGDTLLKEIQRGLEQRGVIDVKLTFAPGFEKVPVEKLKLEVAKFLQAYIDGNSTPITDFGDPPRECEGPFDADGFCSTCGSSLP